MVDSGPPAGISWDALCRDYPATFGGQVGNGFYREKWIAHYRERLEIFGQPPLLQQAYRWAKPVELAARLLAYGLAPESVRVCVFRPEENREQIYAVLSRGNGQPADTLVHLVGATMPAAGDSLLANLRAHAKKLCDELTDATPAPEPNSICPDACPADKSIKWPKPEQIESVLSERPGPVFTCLDRFPATTAGHVAFLEFILIEIQLAIEAKRNQFASRSSHNALADMVRGIGILWSEAAERLATIAGLPPDTVVQVARVLRRELTVGTVERIEELLKPAVVALRDALEDSRADLLGPTGLQQQPAEQEPTTSPARHPSGSTDEQTADDSTGDVFEQIISILDRLENAHDTYGEFISRDEWTRRPSTRCVAENLNVEYDDPESWADTWHSCVADIRAFAADDSQRGCAVPFSTDEGDRLARATKWLLSFVHGLVSTPEEQRRSAAGESGDSTQAGCAENLARLAGDVSELHSLVGSVIPRECACCHKTFTPDRPDVAWCHNCRTGKDRMQSVSIALQCWWKYKQSIPPSLADCVAWNDFRQAFFELFGVRLGDRPNADDADKQQKGWADFEDFLRREKPEGIGEHQWRNTVLVTPISEMVTFLRAESDGHTGTKPPTPEPSKAEAAGPAVPEPPKETTPAESNPCAESDEEENDAQPMRQLLRVFTNGVVDDRLAEAEAVLADDTLTANEKLTRIDRAIRFPATASSERLGQMLGVSKQAVLKTEWWDQNRKGEKAEEIGRRRDRHLERVEQSASTPRDDEAEE